MPTTFRLAASVAVSDIGLVSRRHTLGSIWSQLQRFSVFSDRDGNVAENRFAHLATARASAPPGQIIKITTPR